jgi:hypothetical protein
MQSPPFIIWTLQRTGGTNLASQLIDRAGLAGRLADARQLPGVFSDRLAGISDGWFLHEPFNAGDAARIWGDVTETWSATRDEPALVASLQAICSLRLPFKHCVEMVPSELNAHLLERSSSLGYRHLFLYRRNALDRLLSMQFARLTGLWGAQLKGSVDYAGRAAGVALPVEELVSHEGLCARALSDAWCAIGRLGAERLAIAFEDLWAEPDANAAFLRLREVLCFLDLDQGGVADREFVERIIGTGQQGTREEYAGFSGREDLAKALESLTRFQPCNRIRVLSVESLILDREGFGCALLDDYPAAPRIGRHYSIGGSIPRSCLGDGDQLLLLTPRGERSIEWIRPEGEPGKPGPCHDGMARAVFRVGGLSFPDDAPFDIRLLREGEGNTLPLLRVRYEWRREVCGR